MAVSQRSIESNVTASQPRNAGRILPMIILKPETPDDESAFLDAYRLCYEWQQRVRLNHRGVNITIKPGMTVRSIEDSFRYWQAKKAKRKRK